MNLGNHNNMVKRALKEDFRKKWNATKPIKATRKKKRVISKTQKEREEAK